MSETITIQVTCPSCSVMFDTEIVDELAALRLRAETAEAELKLNASMLARQCDLAREAETELAKARPVVNAAIAYRDSQCWSVHYTYPIKPPIMVLYESIDEYEKKLKEIAISRVVT